MDNKVALILGICLLGAATFDWLANDAQTLIFLGRQMLRLIYWMAFWR